MSDKSSNNINAWMRGFTVAALALLAAAGFAQEAKVGDGGVVSVDATITSAIWTPERVADVAPMPMPKVVDGEVSAIPPLPAHAVPGVAPGWAPEARIQLDPETAYTMGEDEFLDSLVALTSVEPFHGPMPTNPKDGPYPPFQRWTWFGNYLTYPISTIGKLFVDVDGDGDYEGGCSASVIGRSTIATAGHCVSNGAGTWYGGWLFCPSYFGGGGGSPHPARGCWTGVSAATSGAWHNSSEVDLDYACIVTSTTGDVVADKVGNVTGVTGRAWNWTGNVPDMAFGYPGDPPFAGYHIITATSSDWYTNDTSPGDSQYSKYIGNDMTPGSSGGPWWLGVRHKAKEYPDTDGNNNTDPGQPFGPYINGVNSHKRCKVHCGSPPTPTAGVYWEEMGSPAFRSTTDHTGESEDVFALCFDHPNNE